MFQTEIEEHEEKEEEVLEGKTLCRVLVYFAKQASGEFYVFKLLSEGSRRETMAYVKQIRGNARVNKETRG